MSLQNTYQYFEELNSIVEEAMKEVINQDGCFDDIYEQISETVDGHEWIIYNYYTSRVIEYSDNEEAWEELGPDCFIGKSWNEIRQFVAYCAMHADCMDRLSEDKFEALRDELKGEE